MSEQKPLPCAFCGHEPTGRIFSAYMYYLCMNEDCLSRIGDLAPFVLRQWNYFHAAIMAQRRKDFEAGQDATEVRWDTLGDRMEYYDIYNSKTFDEYLEEQKK